MKFFRTCRRFLAGGAPSITPDPIRSLSSAFERRVLLLQIFYIFVLFVAALNFDTWAFHLASPAPNPLWPIAWTVFFSKNTSIFMILGFQAATALLGAFLCRYRVVRILVFLGLLEYVALRNSAGKVGHSFHLLVLISFLLIFLPKNWNCIALAKREIKARTLLIFTACQFLIMMAYSLAGLGKVAMACYQIGIGEVNAFAPRALALHIAQRLLETNVPSYLGPWLIDHAIYAWPMMQATLYLQLFAIMVVLRPSLHRLWAFGLISFHMFSFLILTINFPFNCFILGIFFVVENPPATSLGRMLAQLPLFGMVIRRMFPKLA